MITAKDLKEQDPRLYFVSDARLEELWAKHLKDHWGIETPADPDDVGLDFEVMNTFLGRTGLLEQIHTRSILGQT